MPPPDIRRELVGRLLDSATFARAHQARAFLRYVCERTSSPEAAPPNDAEIAAAVLERDDGGGQASAVVRAQASQVRKRLRQYFATEGAREPVVIELSRGTYTPLFRPREGRDEELPEPSRLGAGGAWWVAAAALLVTAALMAYRPAARTASSSSPQPELDRLWRQMFDNGRPTSVLLADANLTQLQDTLGEALPLDDYTREQMNERIERHLSEPADRVKAVRAIDRRYTTMADVTLAGRILLRHAAHGLHADIILARDATPGLLRDHNVILSGPRRANPWVELFEPRLNFQSRFDEASKRSSFENRAPLPGEEPTYSVRWGATGLCRVAYLPGRDGQGTALLVSGTDMTSTEVGTDFITSERWVHELRARLGVRGDTPLPFFEVLLGSKVVLSRTASQPEILAHRTIADRTRP